MSTNGLSIEPISNGWGLQAPVPAGLEAHGYRPERRSVGAQDAGPAEEQVEAPAGQAADGGPDLGLLEKLGLEGPPDGELRKPVKPVDQRTALGKAVARWTRRVAQDLG